MGWRNQSVVHHTLQFCIFQSCICTLAAIQAADPAGCRIPLAMAAARN
jgi:hypothetical protein